jgi:hypothetical protein
MVMRRVLLPLILFAGCGGGATGDVPVGSMVPEPVPSTTTLAMGPATTAPGTLPATTVFVLPTAPSASFTVPEPITVDEPCPEPVGFSTSSEDSPMFDEAGRLEPMLGIVLAYGGQHLDQFGTYGLIWHAEGDASVFISFASDLAVHRAELGDLVPYPDELIVCQVAIPGEVARALIAKLVDDYQGRLGSVGQSTRGIEVRLMPGEQALADQLVAEYGDVIEVSVCPDEASCVEAPA